MSPSLAELAEAVKYGYVSQSEVGPELLYQMSLAGYVGVYGQYNKPALPAPVAEGMRFPQEQFPVQQQSGYSEIIPPDVPLDPNAIQPVSAGGFPGVTGRIPAPSRIVAPAQMDPLSAFLSWLTRHPELLVLLLILLLFARRRRKDR